MAGTTFWVAIAVIAVAATLGDTVLEIIKASGSGGKFKPRIEGLEEQVHALESYLLDARHRVEVLEKLSPAGSTIWVVRSTSFDRAKFRH